LLWSWADPSFVKQLIKYSEDQLSTGKKHLKNIVFNTLD